MELTSNDLLIWVGKKIDSRLIDKGLAEGSVVKLNTTFRVPSKVMTHIRNNHVIPISDLPKSNDVQGMDVVRTKITLNGPNQVESLSKDILAEKLCEVNGLDFAVTSAKLEFEKTEKDEAKIFEDGH